MKVKAGTSGSSSVATRDVIRVHGARENNLVDVDVEIPKRQLTVFTGVSGSGKSSLVFDTIAAESQRLMNETYSAFVQGFMARLPRPEADVLEGLTAAIVVDQRRMGADPRSTVGTATDANAMLRILFSRLGHPHVGPPSAFSFNVATVRASGSITVDKGAAKTVKRTFTRTGGMCPTCEGRGAVSDLKLSELLDDSLSINEGAILVPGYTVDNFFAVRPYIESGLLDPDKAIRSYSKAELSDLLHHEPVKVKIQGVNVTFEGLIAKVQRSILARDPATLQPHIRAFVERAASFKVCPDCAGTRISETARSSLIGGRSIADACAMQVSDLVSWVEAIDVRSSAPLLRKLTQTLEAFVEAGLGYLSLDRPTGTLSGGESQRVKFLHLGSTLTDVTYVFDEPTSGLHPHDVARMNEMLLRLRDRGNTVLVVEHDPQTISVADHVIDLGPGAGFAGGRVCFAGDVSQLKKSGTLTGRHFDKRCELKATVRAPSGVLSVRNATTHNLRGVDVDIPLGVLVVVTGVAGSGKSSLVRGSLAGRDGVVVVDQTPIRGSRRSNPATYSGLFEPIRKAFAKANSLKPALFSANSEGACETCGGTGVIYTALAVMADVADTCEDCEGKRFKAEVLRYRLAGKDISEVLDLSVDEAGHFFDDGEARIPAAKAVAGRVAGVGLGYLKLGQALTTLSGGELQRLKLATRPAESGGVYVLDEPTSGLHPADIEHLLGFVDRLVDSSVSVVIIEHNLAVVAHADWIIDLGPGAGHDGGQLVFEGTPAKLAFAPTLTGRYLADYLRAGR